MLHIRLLAPLAILMAFCAGCGSSQKPDLIAPKAMTLAEQTKVESECIAVAEKAGQGGISYEHAVTSGVASSGIAGGVVGGLIGAQLIKNAAAANAREKCLSDKGYVTPPPNTLDAAKALDH